MVRIKIKETDTDIIVDCCKVRRGVQADNQQKHENH
jgi:hypothetical protein